MKEIPGVDGPPALPWRVRLFVTAALLPVALFTVACLLYNAPASPVQARLARPVNDVMAPYFSQDWELFAPTPGTSNDLLYLEVTMRRAGSGTTVQTKPLEIEGAIDRTPRDRRWNPTKLPGVVLAFQENAADYARQFSQIDENYPADERAAQKKALLKRYTPTFQELQRFLSVRAASLYPDAKIIAVRGTFKQQPIVPFSQRYERPAPRQPVTGILKTAWMAYVPGVAN
ncbi:DUF5819 family protein [Streptomyces incarnatus]|uniref:DUF5819 family protein n=1 Tax=Streptomyces incarnatus TaxID=665007 RepID=UPI000A5C9E95|nr:DUF5819 family protein [Streptomyces incarnatus]